MVETITATYAQHDDDWTITVTGHDKTLTAKAPGIIAARDRADQLVEKLTPKGHTATVVHLLNGSALEFTTAYMTARMSRPEPTETEDQGAQASAETASTDAGAARSDANDSSAEEADATTKKAADAKATSAEDDESAGQHTPQRGPDGDNASTPTNSNSGIRVKSTDISGQLDESAQNTPAGTASTPPA